MVSELLPWPYPIDYDAIHEVPTDILVIGGGVAGSWAAIYAARRGVKVALIEKTDTLSAGPAGCDDWHDATDNPCCKITADELIKLVENTNGGYFNGITNYIAFREGYDALLELERMGAKVRDTEDEFKGAAFRDDDTKLLFGYDYENRFSIRVWGQTFRSACNRELVRQGVNIYNRIMVTSLLTENGEIGSRVVGAVGIHTRTGELYVFKAKATILCAAHSAHRIWRYRGYTLGPGHSAGRGWGDGTAMAWSAGAAFTMMERSFSSKVAIGTWTNLPPDVTGAARGCWYPCTIVDAKGKEVPFVDKDGRVLTSFEQRVRPSILGQRLFLRRGRRKDPNLMPMCLADRPEFAELVKKGEYTLPLYADLTSMPEHERKAAFRLMLAQEGKGWIGYRNLTQAGFDPEKDMLQAYNFIEDLPVRDELFNAGGLVTDWTFKTNLEGLYAPGDVQFAVTGHNVAAVSGRWAAYHAVEYAEKAPKPVVSQDQVERESKRVYGPINREDGIEWKELNAGMSAVMRRYCNEYKNDELLNLALLFLKEIEEGEAKSLVARNPHELTRALEVLNILTVAEIIVRASLARKASSELLEFERVDYPQMDPPEWNKFIVLKLGKEGAIIDELPKNYWLLPPNAPTYEENYLKWKPKW